MKERRKPTTKGRRIPRRQPPLIELEGTVVMPTKRQMASRAAGKIGGLTTSRRYGAEFKSMRGIAGGCATRDRYGIAYYSEHFKAVWKRRKAAAK